MAHPQHTLSLDHLEEALTVLFCLIDDTYSTLNPRGAYRYEPSNTSPIRRSSLWPSSSSLGAWSRSVRSCVIASDSSRTCSQEWWDSIPFLVQPAREEAQALLGAATAGDPPRVGGRSSDPACGLHFAGSPPSAPDFSVGGLGKLFGILGTLPHVGILGRPHPA